MQANDVPRRPNQVSFFVLDGGGGRLLAGRRVPPAGRLHVDEVAKIENHEEQHEHGRPSPLSAKGGKTYASEGHEDEHQLHRFAKRVVVWIEQLAGSIETPLIPLFAPPRLLGELRKLYGPALSRRVREHQADLTHLSASALAKHPAVLELIPD